MVPSNRRESLGERALRFARALVVGSGATLVDFSVLTACIRLAQIAPTSARLPALVAGASVQFFGNRTYSSAPNAAASRGKPSSFWWPSLVRWR